LVGRAQSRADVSALRDQLRGRYDVVLLQQGLALVPHAQRAGVRMIQVVDGAVTVDGETLTGRQLTQKLGSDAPLIVQISYLDRASQRALAAPAAGAETPAAAAASEPAD